MHTCHEHQASSLVIAPQLLRLVLPISIPGLRDTDVCVCMCVYVCVYIYIYEGIHMYIYTAAAPRSADLDPRST